MSKNEIQTKVIPSIVEKIVKYYQPEKIILFGSYAYGEPDDDSDIDFLIIKESDNKRRMDSFVEVKRIIYDPKLKTPVSPLILTKEELQERLNIGDDFIKEIISKGEIMYER